MANCANCGEAISATARFCSACGAPVAAAGANRPSAPRVEDEDPTRLLDEEATRVGGDEEATRVASRSPFDDSRAAPARVQRLGDLNDPNAQAGARARPPIYAPPPQQSVYDQGAQPPRYDPRASQLARQQSAPRQPVAQPPSRVAAADDDAERVVFSVRPTMLFVGLGYALAALAAVGLTILLARYSPLSAFYSLVVSLPLLLVPAYYHLRRNTTKYTLTDSKIEIDRGLVARRTRNIPLRNIQDVTVSATIPQRLLGFGDLIVENASEVGGTTVMHNIPSPRRHAEMLLRELRRHG